MATFVLAHLSDPHLAPLPRPRIADLLGKRGLGFINWQRRRRLLALIGLSSALPTPPFLATGLLGSDQLRGLAETLERLRRDGAFRVVLVHHPPRSKPSRHYKRLVDGPALREVLAQHGAELL